MRVRLSLAALVNSVFTNIAAGARRINMGILFTNGKFSSIHSVSAPRRFSYTEKKDQKPEHLTTPKKKNLKTMHGKVKYSRTGVLLVFRSLFSARLKTCHRISGI